MKQISSMIITHKKASLDIIERAWHRDVPSFLQRIKSFNGIEECFIIQTCNRVEIYLVAKAGEAILRRIAIEMQIPDQIPVFHDHNQSIRHLMRLASGLESMIVGEDQILGQLKDFYELARKAGTIGEVLSTVLDKAIAVGKRARRETGINKGAVSIGSAAVELAEKLLGKLDDKNLLIIGAGEMASLVAKAVASRNPKQIYIASRTFERAMNLAREFKGAIPVEFTDVPKFLIKSEVVICATSAPHYIITPKVIPKEKQLLIIDLGTPRNVAPEVGKLSNVELHNIDSLRAISYRNLEHRRIEALKVESIIEVELNALKNKLKQQMAEGVIAALYQRAEEIRKQELERAIRKLGNKINAEERDILEALTNSIVSKILAEPTKVLKNAALNDDKEFIENIERLFNLGENNENNENTGISKRKNAEIEKT
ncbi:MAG: glutamyl-tRNA reductase [Methanocellales archaeon]